ncbi:MAG: hypothetical protein C0602_10540 [Denitrovibrio sp.]|nr:MAG: hypothetical protein C0602_10540 [Denitrovibrio sp.]
MNSNKQNLFFFFPYRGVGGVPVLFLRLAHHIETLDIYNIYLIDYDDGYMSENYDKSKSITFIKYSPQDNINFKDDDIVVFQSMPLWGMPPNLIFSDKTKLIYWNLHPYNMFGYASSIGKRFKNEFVQTIVKLIFRYVIYGKDRKAVRVFDRKKSIFYMDGENFEQTRRWLNVKLQNELYLPLIVDNIENIKTQYNPNHKDLNCIWIGRIGDFKVHILIYVLKKLNELAEKNNLNIKFLIAGMGEFLELLKESVKDLDKITINYVDYIAPDNLKDYLREMDIGFAMGTAALDLAKYGLPTVLLDFAYENIEDDYKFDWIYNTKNYTLGREISSRLCEKDNQSLENIMHELSDNFQSVSCKSFEYVNNSFNIQDNVLKFLELVQNADLMYSDLDKSYFKMNMLHNIIGAKKYYND